MFRDAVADRETLMRIAAETGFHGIELWGRDADFEEWLALSRRFGLPLRTMVGHRAALNRRECHTQAQAELEESIRVAREHGVSGLICFGGNRIEDQSDAEAIEIVTEGLRRVLPAAEEAGVTLLLELLNSKVDHPGYLADHTAWGVAVCRGAESPRLRLLYDIYHMQIMEGDLIRTLRENIDWIGHFHIAGNPGRHEPGPDQEINYRAVADAVRAAGYSGFVGHEYAPVGDAATALREAFTLFAPPR